MIFLVLKRIQKSNIKVTERLSCKIPTIKTVWEICEFVSPIRFICNSLWFTLSCFKIIINFNVRLHLIYFGQFSIISVLICFRSSRGERRENKRPLFCSSFIALIKSDWNIKEQKTAGWPRIWIPQNSGKSLFLVITKSNCFASFLRCK